MAKIEKEKVDRLTSEIYDDFTSFYEQFDNETDRAAVVLGAAKIDKLLADIIIKSLKPKIEKDDELLRRYAPLSTFSAKIDFAYRLGRIDEETRKSLHLIRKIRNDFAHEITSSTLSGERNRIGNLKDLVDSRKFQNVVTNTRHSQISFDFRIVLGILVIRLSIISKGEAP